MVMMSLLTFHGELARVHGKINGMKSLYAGSALKCGFGSFEERCYILYKKENVYA
jgi:hypothetical protein